MKTCPNMTLAVILPFLGMLSFVNMFIIVMCIFPSKCHCPVKLEVVLHRSKMSQKTEIVEIKYL